MWLLYNLLSCQPRDFIVNKWLCLIWIPGSKFRLDRHSLWLIKDRQLAYKRLRIEFAAFKVKLRFRRLLVLLQSTQVQTSHRHLMLIFNGALSVVDDALILISAVALNLTKDGLCFVFW